MANLEREVVKLIYPLQMLPRGFVPNHEHQLVHQVVEGPVNRIEELIES